MVVKCHKTEMLKLIHNFDELPFKNSSALQLKINERNFKYKNKFSPG